MTSRRRFLGLAALAALPRTLASQDTTSAADPLRDPRVIGQARAPLTELDNDPVVIAIERRLRCTCGCTLDVYTCRTTDFTCTTSPALHREVVAHWENGLTAEQIQDEFVREYGEQALMAPKPEGFNLAGYLVPGAVMLAGIGALSLWILRRQRQVEAAAIGAVPVDAGRPGAAATSSELERLQRALSEIDD